MNNVSPLQQTQQIIKNSVITQQTVQNSNINREASSKDLFICLSLLLVFTVIGIFIIKKLTEKYL